MYNLTIQTDNQLKLKNEDAIQEAINELKTKYSSLVVSNETKRDTEKVVADLRKTAKAINRQRIDIGKAYKKPLDEFKSKIDGYIAEINEITDVLDTQLNELEANRKAEKQKQIDEIIDEMKTSYEYSGSINQNSKWLNKTYTTAQIAKDVKEQIKQAKRDEKDWEVVKKYAVNNNVNAEYYRAFIGTYTVFDIQKMIDDDVSEMQKQQKELQKEQKRDAVDVNGEVQESIQEVSFTVRGTKEQLDELAKYITSKDMVITNHSERKNVLGGQN